MSITFSSNPVVGQPGTGSNNWGQILNILLEEIKSAINTVNDDLGAHDHDDLYALIEHLHAEYAEADHDHAGIYSPVSHNHTGTYAPATHTHTDDDVTISPSVNGKTNLRDILVDLFAARTANTIQRGLVKNMASTGPWVITEEDILEEIGIVNNAVANGYVYGINHNMQVQLFTVNKATQKDEPSSLGFSIENDELNSIRHLKNITFTSLGAGDYRAVLSFRLVRIDQVSIFGNETEEIT